MKDEKILIVDDEEDLSEVMSLYFTMEGFTVQTALDGFIALDMIQKDIPSLIISDIRMPNCDGFCLIEEINRRDHPPPPIIFMSGYVGTSGDLARLSQYSNFVKYFTKPVDIKDLINEVKDHMKQSDDSANPHA